MYPNYNIPQPRQTMQSRRNFSQGRFLNNGDRFIGGGFLGPFLLGGIAGSLVGRPNYGYPPPPIIYYPPVPRPYYNNNNYYYY